MANAFYRATASESPLSPGRGECGGEGTGVSSGWDARAVPRGVRYTRPPHETPPTLPPLPLLLLALLSPSIARGRGQRPARHGARPLSEGARRLRLLGLGPGGAEGGGGPRPGLRLGRPRPRHPVHRRHPVRHRLDQQAVHGGGGAPAGDEGQAQGGGQALPVLSRRASRQGGDHPAPVADPYRRLPRDDRPGVRAAGAQGFPAADLRHQAGPSAG